MMWTLMSMIFLATSILIWTKNPMKMSAMITLISALMFLMMSLSKGSSWMPMIFYLLFMGGILIMFMILSSLSPNEPSMKVKWSMCSMLIVAMFLSMVMSLSEMTELYQEMIKQGLTNFSMISLVSILVILYFFSFLIFLTEKKTSMRSTMTCWKKVIL